MYAYYVPPRLRHAKKLSVMPTRFGLSRYKEMRSASSRPSQRSGTPHTRRWIMWHVRGVGSAELLTYSFATRPRLVPLALQLAARHKVLEEAGRTIILRDPAIIKIRATVVQIEIVRLKLEL